MERECKKWKSELAENEAPKKLADFIEPATEEELKLDIRKSVLDAVRVHRAKKKYAAYKRRLNRRKPK